MDKTPVQRAILVDLLIYDDDKAANIGRRTGFHRNSVSSNMGELVENELIVNKGGGVYRLTDSGLETARALVRAGEIPYDS